VIPYEVGKIRGQLRRHLSAARRAETRGDAEAQSDIVLGIHSAVRHLTGSKAKRLLEEVVGALEEIERIIERKHTKTAKRNPLTAKEAAYHLREAKSALGMAKSTPRSRGGAFDAGRAYGQAKVVMSSGPKKALRPADRIRNTAMSMMQRTGWGNNSAKTKANPGRRRRVTMSLNEFAKKVKATGDKRLWNDFVKKINGYKKWTHGTMPKTVTVEKIDKPGMNGIWMTYAAGKQPEALYSMPGNSKRKGAWRHPWTKHPSLKHDPETGIIMTKLVKGNKITDFLHG
jgi:hypothetical protein